VQCVLERKNSYPKFLECQHQKAKGLKWEMEMLPLLEASARAIHFSMAESHFLGTSLTLVGYFKKVLIPDIEDELYTSMVSNFCMNKKIKIKLLSDNEGTFIT